MDRFRTECKLQQLKNGQWTYELYIWEFSGGKERETRLISEQTFSTEQDASDACKLERDKTCSKLI